MQTIVQYDVINPIIVKETPNSVMGIPEGSTVGFDGEYIYVKNFAQQWRKMLTNRLAMLGWIKHGSVKRKLLFETPGQEEIKKRYTPGEQAPKPAPAVIPLGPASIPEGPPVLPMVPDRPQD